MFTNRTALIGNRPSFDPERVQTELEKEFLRAKLNGLDDINAMASAAESVRHELAAIISHWIDGKQTELD